MHKFVCVFLLTLLVSCGKKTDEIQSESNKLQVQNEQSNKLSKLKEAIDSQDTQFLIKEIENNKNNINNKFDDGETPLTYAIRQKNERVINLLIDASDVNVKGKNDLSPLHLSIILNLRDIIDSLLNKNADIEITSQLGQTPLYLAISFEREDIALKLLSLNANFETKSNLDMSPKELAQGFRLTRVLTLIKNIEETKNEGISIDTLINAIEENNDYFFKYILNKHPEIIELAKGQDVFSRIIEGNSLYKSYYIGKLLDFGFNANGEVDDIKNPLIIAAKMNDEDIVEKLVRAGANVNIVMEEPYYTNPLFEATKNVNYEMVLLLYMYGAEKRINYVHGNALYFIDACNSLPRRRANELNSEQYLDQPRIRTLLKC